MEMTMERSLIGLAIAAHPLRPEIEHRFTTAGRSLAKTLADEGVNGYAWVISVGGIDVPPEYWSRIRVKPGHLIECRALVRKQVLQLGAIVALTYFTMGAGGIAGGSFMGLTGAAGAMAAGAAFVGGTLVMNKLLAPSAARIGGGVPERAQSYGISGGRNTAREYQPLGLMLGECKVVPDLASQQFTWFDGDDQYLACMLHGGINCGSVSSLRLGDTLLSTYANVKITRAGFPTGNDGPMPSMSVDSVAGGTLERTTDAEPQWTTRTTSRNTVRIAVDLEATLSSVSNTGAWEQTSVEIDAEYRVVGRGWLPFAGGRITLTNSSGKPVRRTIVLDVEPAQYEVRLRKVSRNANSTQRQNAINWPTLKSYQADPSDYAGQPRVLLEIKATGQLSGALDSVSWISRAAAMPVWTGEEWVTATEPGAAGISNPGAQILMLMRGIRRESDGRLIAGMGLPDSKIDMESLKAFMVRCKVKNFRFDDFVQEAMNLGALLDAIADAGFGRISRGSGKYGAVWLAEDQPIRGVINMATMKAKSFSVDYDLLPTAEEAQADFYDRDSGYSKQSVRVVSPLVTATPDRQASISLRGVTGAEHAAQRIRFMLGQSAYARKSISWEMDLEYLTHRSGSLVSLSHDLTQWGCGGRVASFERSADSWTIGLDVELPALEGRVHMVALVLPREDRLRIYPVASVSEDRRSLTVRQAWPKDAAVPGDGVDVLDVTWLYDIKPTPGYRCRIVSVVPNGGMTGARITAVPEAPELWDYVWNGNWSRPAGDSLLSRLPPVAGNATITAERTRLGEAWQTTLTVSFDASGNFDHAQIWAAVGDAPLEMVAQTNGVRASWPADRGQRWRVEVRPFDSLGRMGTVAAATYAVAADAPTEVQELRIAMTEQGAEVSWARPDGVQGVDWSITEVRTGPTWRAGSVAFSGRADFVNLGWLSAGKTTVWASHRNTAGEWSDPVNAHIDVAMPGEPLLVSRRDQATVRLDWQDCRTSQPLRGYRLLQGARLAEAVPIGTVAATSFTRMETAGGRQRYWVRAEDVAGNLGDAGTVEIEVLPSAETVLAALDLANTELGRVLTADIDVVGGVAKRAEDLAAKALAAAENQVAAAQADRVVVRANAAAVDRNASQIASVAAQTAQEILDLMAQDNAQAQQLASYSETVGNAVRQVSAVASRVDGVESSAVMLRTADAARAAELNRLSVKSETTANQVTEAINIALDAVQRVSEVSSSVAGVEALAREVTEIKDGVVQNQKRLSVQTAEARSTANEAMRVYALSAEKTLSLETQVGDSRTELDTVKRTTAKLVQDNALMNATNGTMTAELNRLAELSPELAKMLVEMKASSADADSMFSDLREVTAEAMERTLRLSHQSKGFHADITRIDRVSSSGAVAIETLRQTGANTAGAVASERTARATDVAALGQRIDSVSAVAGAARSQAQLLAEAKANLDGSLSTTMAMRLRVDSRGRTIMAGVGVGIVETPGGAISEVYNLADRFAFLNEINGVITTPFVIQDGRTLISQALIGEGWITNAMIGEEIRSTATDAYGRPAWRLLKTGSLEVNGTGAGWRLTLNNTGVRIYDTTFSDLVPVVELGMLQ